MKILLFKTYKNWNFHLKSERELKYIYTYFTIDRMTMNNAVFTKIDILIEFSK